MLFKYVCLVLFITWYQLSADCHPAKNDVRSIDSMIDKETESFISVEAEESSNKNVRNRRTVGFLRQLFPGISQIVDRKIQQITRFLFRVIGRLVLRGGGAGAGGAAGGGGAAGETTSRRISITLPTYPPSTDDDEDEDQDVPAATEVPALVEVPGSTETPAVATEASAAATPEATTEGPVGLRSVITEVSNQLDLRLAAEGPVADSASAASADSAVEAIAIISTTATAATITTTSVPATTAATTTAAVTEVTTTTMATTTTAATAAAITTTNGPTTQRPSDSDNAVGTGIVKRTARDVSADESSSSQKESPLTDTDNDVASADNVLSNTASDDASSLTADGADEDPRNKRFLSNGSGSGGGSGNFLFDLIRLVAGSGANQDRDESSNIAPVEAESTVVHDVNAKEDGYSVGVPGPLTRIFVIANRGVANLVQDLILRLAQTTERIVNFKARLITSLI